MKIEAARNIDAKELTDLTLHSKSYWGYSPDQINEWKNDLTISPEYLDQAEVFKLTDSNQLIGYYSFIELSHKKVKLDNIFLRTEFIGKGFGAILMRHFLQRVKDLGYLTIELESEPFAEEFYLKFGFRTIRRIESSIKERFIPVMELEIEATHNPL